MKQAEVHGMSQRGGDVQSNLRISDQPIASDLIPTGKCDLIISLEPMEALRYLPYLSPEGWLVTNEAPFINIPNYPDQQALMAEVEALPAVVKIDIEQLAREAGNPRGANMVLLGMAAPSIEILSVEQLRQAIATIFARKGESVVEANLKAFDRGVAVNTEKAEKR